MRRPSVVTRLIIAIVVLLEPSLAAASALVMDENDALVGALESLTQEPTTRT